MVVDAVPQLVYHSLAAPLYPSYGGDTVFAVRFVVPVRVSSIRIVPEGVASIHGLGSTYPATFKARVLLNVSPSNPVNALAASTIEFDAAQGWEQDLPLDMPEGAHTRLLTIIGPMERLSLSIYGYPLLGASTQTIAAVAELSLPMASAQQDPHQISGRALKKDWDWVSRWAGGLDGLLNLLDDTSSIPAEIQKRALESLDLLANLHESSSSVFDALISHPTALSYLLLLPSHPPQPLLQKLLQNPKYALSPELRYHLPHDHPLQLAGLVDTRKDTSQTSVRAAAWRTLERAVLLPSDSVDPMIRRGCLLKLREVGSGEFVTVGRGNKRSRLYTLVRLLEILSAEDGKAEKEDFELGLDLLDQYVARLLGIDGIAIPPGLSLSVKTRTVSMKWLAGRLPRLICVSHSRGSARTLAIPTSYAHTVLTCLSSVKYGTDPKLASQATTLAEPYVSALDPNHPLVRLFAPFTTKTAAQTTQIDLASDTPAARAINRLSESLDQSTKISTGLVYRHTPAEILSVISPNLLQSLSTAMEPPLDIPPVVRSTPMHMSGSGSASAFAGKVYSSQEFRNRDTAHLDPGGWRTPPNALPGGVPGKVSRPASRHVDQFKREHPGL